MKPRRRLKILLLVFLTCSVTLSLTYESILRKMGHFLVCDQAPQKADVIVVLNGRDAERSLTAVDLYNQGYADLIALARGPKQPGCDEFFRRVGNNWNRKVFFQRSVEAMGIPERSFTFIGNGVASTYDEAMVTKAFVKSHGYNSILVVTSKWHSRRASLTFKKQFKNDPEISITVIPSQYDSYSPDNWWKNEAHSELVFREYVRLIYYAITLRLSLFT